MSEQSTFYLSIIFLTSKIFTSSSLDVALDGNFSFGEGISCVFV